MAKTVFNDTPPQGTVVTAAFLNAVNRHRHTGEDIDGAGVLNYAETTGTGNAYVIALSPPLTAHIPGMPIQMKANRTNTGAATLKVNDLGAVGIKLPDGADLNHGNIRGGGMYMLMSSGSAYILLNPSERTGKFLMEYSVPAGYLKCDGALVSRTTYADLFSFATARGLIISEAAWANKRWGLFGEGNKSTTFRLPDARGEFVRALDDGRGVDPARTLGSAQKASLAGFDAAPDRAVWNLSNLSTPESKAQSEIGLDPYTHTDYPNTEMIGSTYNFYGTLAAETRGLAGAVRPRNIALVPCIKY